MGCEAGAAKVIGKAYPNGRIARRKLLSIATTWRTHMVSPREKYVLARVSARQSVSHLGGLA